MRTIFCCILTMLGLSLHIKAQVRVVHRLENHLRQGKIILTDSSEIMGSFIYNPLAQGGLLIVKSDSTESVYGPSKVLSFSFLDSASKRLRFFYSLPIKSSEAQEPLGKYFFESIYETSVISLLGRHITRQMSNFNPYNKKRIVMDGYKKYFLDHRNGLLYSFSRKNFIKLIEDNAEVMNYMRQNKYHLEGKDSDQYFELMDLYAKSQK